MDPISTGKTHSSDINSSFGARNAVQLKWVYRQKNHRAVFLKIKNHRLLISFTTSQNTVAKTAPNSTPNRKLGASTINGSR
jgi:hypothetical protein